MSLVPAANRHKKQDAVAGIAAWTAAGANAAAGGDVVDWWFWTTELTVEQRACGPRPCDGALEPQRRRSGRLPSREAFRRRSPHTPPLPCPPPPNVRASSSLSRVATRAPFVGVRQLLRQADRVDGRRQVPGARMGFGMIFSIYANALRDEHRLRPSACVVLREHARQRDYTTFPIAI